MSDGVEDFLFIVSSQQLMDGWKGFKDRLLKDSQADGDSLEIFSSCGYIDVIWLQLTIIDDWFLHLGFKYTCRMGILKLKPGVNIDCLSPLMLSMTTA